MDVFVMPPLTHVPITLGTPYSSCRSLCKRFLSIHLCRWAQDSRTLNRDVTRDIRPVRMVRNRQPVGLTDAEVHALLRAAGASTHGLARRNYALVQLLVQAGLRIGEVSALRLSDIVLRDRTGSVRVRHGK